MTGAGHLSDNATAMTSQSKLSRSGAVVKEDSGSENVLFEAETSQTRLPQSGSNSPRREVPKAQYKAALKIKSRLQDKAALSKEEKEKLAWAEKRIGEGRLHFARKAAMASTGGFENKVEEMLSKKKATLTRECDKEAGPLYSFMS